MKILLTGLVAAAAMFGGAANAATIYATDATIVVDGPRGTSNDRANIDNALGDTIGDFFEIGLGATVDFTFGELFTGPGNVVEVTFGNPNGFPESATFQVGLNGVFTSLGNFSNVGAQAGDGGVTIDFSGTFDTFRIIDTTVTSANAGGFDVDRVGVSPVPLPASALLLIAGLGGLGAMRRRSAKKS